MLIVFEGIDRSGKSTQCRLLCEYLRGLGRPTVSIRYPDRNSPYTGAMINEYLSKRLEMSSETASLVLAANLWEIRDQIVTKEDRHIILMDRYIWSNIAYSKARCGEGQVYERIAEGLPTPDLLIFLDVDPERAAERGGFGEERFDKIEFQQKVDSTMEILKERADCPLLVIDSARSIEDIHLEITSRVFGLLKQSEEI